MVLVLVILCIGWLLALLLGMRLYNTTPEPQSEPKHSWSEWEPIDEYEEDEIIDFMERDGNQMAKPILRKIQQQRRLCLTCGVTQQGNIDWASGDCTGTSS